MVIGTSEKSAEHKEVYLLFILILSFKIVNRFDNTYNFGGISDIIYNILHALVSHAALANMLEILHITENRYSGIPTIRKEFESAGLPAPVFEVRRGEFTVVFKNDKYKSSLYEKKRDSAKDIVEFCYIPRSREELQKFTGFSRYYTMAKIVQPLIDSGELIMTMPDKPKSVNQRYVRKV
ncbi:MAG: hypothetical protein K2H23_04785 [Oscillospiraceae bacterium]|nr:hypothetical protein [Oscillospiraceae bacterium]